MGMSKIPFEKWYRKKLKEERIASANNKYLQETGREASDQQRIAEEFKNSGLRGLLQPQHRRTTAKLSPTGRKTLDKNSPMAHARLTLQAQALQQQAQSPSSRQDAPRLTRSRFASNAS